MAERKTSSQVRDMDTSMAGVLVAIASMEARQAALAVQLLESNAREEERIKNLTDRADERHESLVERLDERHETIEKTQEAILAQLKELHGVLKPIEARVEALEQTKGKVVAVVTTLSGGTVLVSGLVNWLAENWGKWFAHQ